MLGRKPQMQNMRLIEGGLTLSNIPPAPNWLNERAKFIWRTTAVELIERQTLGEGDLGTLANYCAVNSIVQELSGEVDAEGLFEHSERSKTSRPAAAFKSLMQSVMVSARLAAELGLSPASRNKAAKVAATNEDEADDLLA